MTIEDFQHQVRAIKQALQRGQLSPAKSYIQDLLSVAKWAARSKYFIWPLSLTGSRTNIAMLLRLSTLFYLFPRLRQGMQRACLLSWSCGDQKTQQCVLRCILTPLLKQLEKAALNLSKSSRRYRWTNGIKSDCTWSLPPPILGAYDLMYSIRCSRASVPPILAGRSIIRSYDVAGWNWYAVEGVQWCRIFVGKLCGIIRTTSSGATYQNVLSKLGKFQKP